MPPGEVRYYLESSRLEMQIGKTDQHKYPQAIKAYQNTGDSAGFARVKKIEETDRFNKQVEEENRR